jgi:hypothetical protein
MRAYFCLIATLCLLLSTTAIADIYKTVDKNGHAVYTDLPPANSNAKTVELESINTIPKTDVRAYTPTQSPTKHPALSYNLRIISPKSGTDLSPSERNLQVAILVDNALVEGLFFAYLIDGQVALESTDLSIVINEPPRGTHQLSVAVRNKQGEQFGESEQVSFNVFRPIIKRDSPRH